MEAAKVQKEKGFSVLEFLVTMTLLVILFAAAFEIFVPVMKRSKVEGANVQTQIEGIIGLELLRRDVVQAGCGLPWLLPANATYNEATPATPATFNDATANSPRSIIVADNIAGTDAAFGVNSSDYLVVKSTTVGNPITSDGTTYAENSAANKWTTVKLGGTSRAWGDAEHDLAAGDKVIVVQPANVTGNMMLTVNGAGVWAVDFSNALNATYSPTTANTSWYVFGVDDANALRMPFNRADYYISSNNVPSRCLPGTGVLVKSVVRQDDGSMGQEFPLLDCVAEFQVVLGAASTGGTEAINCFTNNLSSLTLTPALSGTGGPAQQVRDHVKEVRLYILAQEGGFDPDYKFDFRFVDPTDHTVLVGENSPATCDNAAGTGNQSCNCSGADGVLGTILDMDDLGPDFEKYRWRVYQMTIKPESIITASGS